MQLLFREIFTQCDVLPNRSIEQEHILLNVTHLLLELSGCNGVNVHIVKRNRTGVVRQPAQKQLEQSGFSTAGGSCQGILFALFKVEGGIFQDGLFLIIAERNSIYVMESFSGDIGAISSDLESVSTVGSLQK